MSAVASTLSSGAPAPDADADMDMDVDDAGPVAPPPVLANLDGAEDEVLLVQLPQDLASSLREQTKALGEGATVQVGSILEQDTSKSSLVKKLALTYKLGMDKKREYNIEAKQDRTAKRIFVHERVEDTNVKGKRHFKRAFKRPEKVAFRGIVIAKGHAKLQQSNDDVLAFGALLKRKADARNEEKKKRRTKILSVSDGKKLAGQSQHTSSSAFTSNISKGNTSTSGDRKAAKLPDEEIKTAIYSAFDVLPPDANGAMTKKEIISIRKIRSQRVAWIDSIIKKICIYHREKGPLHGRYTLKT